MFESRLAAISAKLERLRELDPFGTVLFGADYHRYLLNPPATSDLIQKFESNHGIALPTEYREFLLQLGNGGAGPFFGLWALHVPEDREYEDVEFFIRNGQKCFVMNENHPLFEKVSAGKFSDDPRYRDGVECGEEDDLVDDFTDLSVEIGTAGCGIEILLVCSGSALGQVWQGSYEDVVYLNAYSVDMPDLEKMRSNSGGCYTTIPDLGNQYVRIYDVNPFQLGGEPMTFLDWYEHWLNTGLRWFEE